MLCRVLLHAVNLRHGTDGFTSPPKEVRATDFITHKNPPSSAGPEPTAASPMGPLASTLTTRLRAAICSGTCFLIRKHVLMPITTQNMHLSTLWNFYTHLLALSHTFIHIVTAIFNCHCQWISLFFTLYDYKNCITDDYMMLCIYRATMVNGSQ
jgi:hypothetical protein